MGVEWKSRSFKASQEFWEKFDRLTSAFSPFTSNSADMFRLQTDILFDIVFTRSKLQAVVERLQGILRVTASAQLEFDFPSLAAPGQSAGSSGDQLNELRRPRVVSISRRSAVRHSAVVLGTVAWVPSFRKTFASAARIA